MSLLLRQKPFIASDAIDWNVTTQRFDSKCGVTTCSGGTGGMELGTVVVGTETGNGAQGRVAFVGGGTTTRMQWGRGSIAPAFTICSITRYSGGARYRILSCKGNHAGSLDWWHGHWHGNAGSIYYDDAHHGMQHYTISSVGNWIVACGSNVNNIGGTGTRTIVNGDARSSARTGASNCALGINFFAELSDWQLSKLYIWNYHLSPTDFTLAASSLFTKLTTDTSRQGSVCQTCPHNSNSPVGSISIQACECNPGHTGANGAGCTQCPVGTFKAVSGSIACPSCPMFSFSFPGTTNIENCICPAGFTGNDGADCTICPAGTFKPARGSAACVAYVCPANHFSSAEMAIAPGCWQCPPQTLSLENSTSIEACRCPAGTYEETHMLNPLYSHRSYSHVAGGEIFSMLDDRHSTGSWRTSITHPIQQWMHINAGAPMRIVGLITQSKGTANAWIQSYSVEYDTPQPRASLPHIIHRNSNFLKSWEFFPAPIYARNILITVQSYHAVILMRAALIVKSCTSCFASSTSQQGSTVFAACTCPQGLYRYSSPYDARALSLVPGRAQLSTLANRALLAYAATACPLGVFPHLAKRRDPPN